MKWGEFTHILYKYYYVSISKMNIVEELVEPVNNGETISELSLEDFERFRRNYGECDAPNPLGRSH